MYTRAAALVRQEFGLSGSSVVTLEATALQHRTAELLAQTGATTAEPRTLPLTIRRSKPHTGRLSPGLQTGVTPQAVCRSGGG